MHQANNSILIKIKDAAKGKLGGLPSVSGQGVAVGTMFRRVNDDKNSKPNSEDNEYFKVPENVLRFV
jgi:hypothetical protein